MARNKVQFQKGLSEAEFERLFGTEEQCLAQHGMTFSGKCDPQYDDCDNSPEIFRTTVQATRVLARTHAAQTVYASRPPQAWVMG